HLIDDLRNHWIDLAGHDRRAGLHRGQIDLAQSRSRSRAEQSQIIADFRQLHGAALEHTRQLHEYARVHRCLHEIWRRNQLLLRDAHELFAYDIGISARSVDSRSDRRRTHVDLADQPLHFGESLDILENGVAERAELLA